MLRAHLTGVVALLAIATTASTSLAQQGPAESDAAKAAAPGASCASRKFVGNRDLVALVSADLQGLSEIRAKGTRYITLTHLYNACSSDKEMEVYRQGVGKLINSLNSTATVVRLETIDPERTVLRLNIDDIGWAAADWDTLLAAYAYGVQPDVRSFALTQQLTNTKLPYVRGDWLALFAGQPPLYYQLLKLPDKFSELQKQLGIDVEANLKKFLVQRAGMQESGMSPNNRMIERHQSRTGYFWTSYNFATNRGKQNLFNFPLGPRGDNGFEHDLAATFFSLPNGFQAFYLSDAEGARVDKASTQILRDYARRDLSMAAGISCFGCHAKGVIRKVKDEIRALVFANREVAKKTRDAVDALHPDPAQMDKILADDAARFRDAMVRAGLDPDLSLDRIEPINALALRYDANLDLATAAAEFGLRPDEFRAAAVTTGPTSVLMRRLEQGRMPRDQFEDEFAGFVPKLTDETVLNLSP